MFGCSYNQELTVQQLTLLYDRSVPVRNVYTDAFVERVQQQHVQQAISDSIRQQVAVPHTSILLPLCTFTSLYYVTVGRYYNS